MPKRPGEHLSVIDGELQHLDRNGKLHPNHYSESDRRRFYQGLLYLTHLTRSENRRRGVSVQGPIRRLAAVVWSHADPLPPTPEVAAWDRHCRIKFAKAMEKAAVSA